jgi:hypothetical protein
LDLARHGKQFEGKAAAHFACLIYMVDQPKHEQLGINAGAVHAGVTVICSWPEMQQMMHKHSNVRDQASDETCFWGVACMLGNKYSKRAKQTKKQHQCPPHAGQQCHALQIDQHTKYALQKRTCAARVLLLLVMGAELKSTSTTSFENSRTRALGTSPLKGSGSPLKWMSSLQGSITARNWYAIS